MFAISSAERVPANGYMACRYAEELSGNLISGDLARLLDPTQETQTAGGTTEYFNEIVPRKYNPDGTRNLAGQYEAPPFPSPSGRGPG